MSTSSKEAMLADINGYFDKVLSAIGNGGTVHDIDRYGVIGDGKKNDSLAFTNLEKDIKGREVDLLGRVCLVDNIPTGNIYRNGYFLNSRGKIKPADKDPSDLLYQNASATALWASWPTMWTVDTAAPTSGSQARKNPPTKTFAAMNPSTVDQTGFSKGFIPVNGNQLIGVTAHFAYTGTITQGTHGFVVDSIDDSGNYARSKLPAPVLTTQWRPYSTQIRLPVRTVMYRVGIYRNGTTDTGQMFFSRFNADVVIQPFLQTGMGALNGDIDIRKGVIKPVRLMNFTRIGPDPGTAFQDFELIPNSDDLFISSGQELVAGSGVDALIVNQLTRGESEVTATSFQTALEVSNGHGGLSLEAINTGTLRIWSGGSSPGTAVRFKYGGSPTGAPATNVGVYQLFDTVFGESTFPTVSSDGHWLCAVGRGNTNAQVVRIWRIDDLQTPGDCRNTYIHEFDIPSEALGGGYPIQGVAFSESHIFIITGGFSPATPGSTKLIQLTMMGDTVAFIPDLRVGEEDWIANGSAWEPEGLSIYKPGPQAVPCLAVGMKTGAGRTKTSTIWLLGAAGDTLQHSSITVKKSGNVGFTFFRDNSTLNAFHSVRTTAGQIYMGTGDGKNFVVNNQPNNTDAMLCVDDVAFRTGVDNRRSLGGVIYRFTDIFATGTIQTSDGREKTAVAEIRSRVFKAWALVEYREYQWIEAVERKADRARVHFGVIAQQVKEAFESVGLDPFEFGILCYDEWNDVIDEHGGVTTPAGNRYGVRYNEAMIIEAAYLRQCNRELTERMDRLEERLLRLEQ